MSEETKQLLNDCGCCEGVAKETPEPLFNRPGLSEIAYRVGTYAEFRATLHAHLSGSDQPALRALTTRDTNDFSIALLDAWAVVSDVLTFYQERIANEAYLRTATERLSVLELARLIGYELRPGVAANAYLAFTLEDAAGALGQVLAVGTTAQAAPEQLPPIALETGTKVQSVPGPGEQAQTFETIQPIEARPEWNAIKPRLTQEQPISLDMETIFLVGATSGLKKGDRILIVNESGNSSKTVTRVTVDDKTNTTQVDLVAAPSALPAYHRPLIFKLGLFRDFLRRVELNNSATQQIAHSQWREADVSAITRIQRWSVSALVRNISKLLRTPALTNNGVFVFRKRAAAFGYNAPKQPEYDGTKPKPPSQWSEWPIDASEEDNSIFLDAAYEEVLPGSYITIEQPGQQSKTFEIKNVNIFPRTAYGISSKTTLVTLPTDWRDKSKETLADLRNIAIDIQSEQLPLAEIPIEDLIDAAAAVEGITLNGIYLGLKAGQRVIITGERTDLSGVYGNEALTLKEIIIENGFTVVTFNESLAFTYIRRTVTISANVAPATHGETVQETLGSGDGTQVFQKFVLRQPPLTYVSSADPSGASTTLEVRVNDILWHEVADFYGHGPQERIYVTRRDDAGNTTVIFGDGKTGARLPTGQENVKAKYRKGIGLGGLVKADQLTQLMTRPLGVKSVTNPIAPSGAADPEILDEAKQNAPLTILTLGRVVSLRDYEDFARAFSGIGKALATSTWFGEARGVFVTVAGANGADVEDPGVLHTNLVNAIRASGDSLTPVLVKSFSARFFRVTAQLKVDPDYLAANVLAAAEKSLRAAFSFDARAFGQPVHLSEVISILQNISGVLAVNVTELYRSDEDPHPYDHIAAALPLVGGTGVFPAELLTLDPRPVDLSTFV
jgi:hypothetical protein